LKQNFAKQNRISSRKAKKEYGTKMWKHWPTRLLFINKNTHQLK